MELFYISTGTALILFLSLSFIYLIYLALLPKKESDKIYYYEGKYTYENVLAQIERIEKQFGKDYSYQKKKLKFYYDNSQKTRRVFDYYSDYIDPWVKYASLNNTNIFKGAWKITDNFLRTMFACLLLMIITAWITINNHWLELNIHIIWLILFNIVLLVLTYFSTLMIFIKIMSLFLTLFQSLFRLLKLNLGPINKSIIAIDSLIISLMVHQLTGFIAFTAGGVASGFFIGGAGGTSFGGFGGGSFGGGGASGSW